MKKKYYAMKTLLSDSTKETFRIELLKIVGDKYSDPIGQGVCDYLYSCSTLEPHDVLRAIDESEIKPTTTEK
jgi:hypothetical protein